jgi:glutaredoxin
VPTAATVTLLTRPACHLCDAARQVVAEVAADFASVTVVEKSILDDPALLERYVEEIPVVLVNDRVHNIWRVDPARFRLALEEATE